MSIIDDFEDIAMRMNRKEQTSAVEAPSKSAIEAAVRTLQGLGYTYCDGAQMWKPPLGQAPSQVNDAAREALEERIKHQYREWMTDKLDLRAPTVWYAVGGS